MYSQEEKDKMAMKNSVIDKFSAEKGCPAGQYWNGKKCVKDLKNPSQGNFSDFNNRTQATITKFRESSTLFSPSPLWKKEERTMDEQKALNQDLKLHQYEKQVKNKEMLKRVTEKNKMLKLQNKKGSYKKEGF